LAPPDPEAACAESTAQMLLERYGVVFRDLLERETGLPPWRDVLVALRRMEARGEIRGGRFVAGFVGEQFALPEAVDGLRASRNPPRFPELVRLAATDPLNLVGVTSPGPKVPAVIGNAILFRDGVAIASLEAGALVSRHALDDGARVDEELGYHSPPRPTAPAPQLSLLN
jgi:ATP-dependent Lhr-like helicase